MSVWQIMRSIILISLLEFLQGFPTTQIWLLVTLECFCFGLVYVKKPHLDGTERVAALAGSLINLFFLLCPVVFVYRGFQPEDAAGLMIICQMLVIVMEIYNQLASTVQTLRDVCTMLCANDAANSEMASNVTGVLGDAAFDLVSEFASFAGNDETVAEVEEAPAPEAPPPAEPAPNRRAEFFN
jgi:hypothetical protein